MFDLDPDEGLDFEAVRAGAFQFRARIDRASRNEIAKLPVREFAKGKHSPHGVANLGYRNARAADVVDQVADNRLANVR
ncbi:hypothetical protein [Mesorhizobium sp. M0220]|uniref:hypothetical protein n=1 Tax=Mesorhizobium sp. M0220 TaxID=2956920 RepID=UPI0033393931